MNKPPLVIGIILLALGSYMQVATYVRPEQRFRTVTTVKDTRGRNATIGAGAGAVAGGGAAAVVGGIGITAMGTGVGAPAGAILIGIAALLGAGTGAAVGAASGEKVISTTQVPYTIEIIEKSYSSYVSLGVLVLGSFVVIWVIGNYLKKKVSNNTYL